MLLGLVEQQLHPQTAAEHRRSRSRALAQQLVESALLELAHAGGEVGEQAAAVKTPCAALTGGRGADPRCAGATSVEGAAVIVGARVQIIAARISGASDAEIRKLVERLHEQRKTAVADLVGA